MRDAEASTVQPSGFGRWVPRAEARGLNAGLVSSHGPLEGAWIEVFRAGDYGAQGHWGERELDQMAASYNPRLHAAPIVLGHPQHDAPAFAWVKALRRVGGSLWAQLEQVEPGFAELLRAGRFRTRSVALYTRFPRTRGPYLRHVGFLGAQAPEVKGLAPIRFAQDKPVGFAEAPTVTFEFDSVTRFSEVEMSEPKSKLDAFLEHLRRFFAADPTSAPGPEPPASGEAAAFSERIAQLEQRLDQLAEEKRTAEEKLAASASNERTREIEVFIETLRGRGKFPPVFEQMGVRTFMERLTEADAQRAASIVPRAPETDDTKLAARSTEPESLLAWFQEFLMRLPAVINFNELAAAPIHDSRFAVHEKLVRFAEPGRGVAVDPESVELAERAEALASELGISYADALARIRAEQRAQIG